MTNCILHPESLWLFILPTKNKTAFFAFNSFNKNRPSCFIDNSDANLHPYSRKSPITSNLHFWGSPVPHDRDSSKKCSNRCHKNSKQSNNNIPVHVWQAPIEGYLGGTSYSTAYSWLAPLLTLGAIFATMQVGDRSTLPSGKAAPVSFAAFLCSKSFYGADESIREDGCMAWYMLRTSVPPFICRRINGGLTNSPRSIAMSKPTVAPARALSFNHTQFNVIERNAQTWLTSSEIAQALGYARPDSVNKIYERNKDEFPPD